MSISDEVKHAMQEKYSLQEELDVLRKHLQRLELDNNAQKGEIESLQLLVQGKFYLSHYLYIIMCISSDSKNIHDVVLQYWNMQVPRL